MYTSDKERTPKGRRKRENKMKIEGIGVISKNKAMSILTKEGRKAVKAGEITIDELGEMYKLELVKKNSKVGNMGDTFRESYKWIPEELKKQLKHEVETSDDGPLVNWDMDLVTFEGNRYVIEYIL